METILLFFAKKIDAMFELDPVGKQQGPPCMILTLDCLIGKIGRITKNKVTAFDISGRTVANATYFSAARLTF